MAVCPMQLNNTCHEGITTMKFLVDYADNTDEVHPYMTEVLDIPRLRVLSPNACQVHLGLLPLLRPLHHQQKSAMLALESMD